MQVFHQYLDKVDRLQAASPLPVQAGVPDMPGTKAQGEAERLIKVIDQEFKNKY
jgi:hypothetical protein